MLLRFDQIPTYNQRTSFSEQWFSTLNSNFCCLEGCMLLISRCSDHASSGNMGRSEKTNMKRWTRQPKKRSNLVTPIGDIITRPLTLSEVKSESLKEICSLWWGFETRKGHILVNNQLSWALILATSDLRQYNTLPWQTQEIYGYDQGPCLDP